ncbi:hypothetical protein [Polyangium sp. y55x31]|uniref:hypothetical protein n=1 Tax=Polyangium sp. y55x31 TaxID=3042688 RepID=UPI0024831E1F|nr:hypothetical protein [Polyangium sp. y55x31]MDI1483298.1 hypothetical protein [Polyangium sp. y55x31]
MGCNIWLLVGVGLAAAFATGCGPDIAALCEAREACHDGNEADIDACIVNYEGNRDAAHDVGCGAEFDVLVACMAQESVCSSADTNITCTSRADCASDALCNDGKCIHKSFGIPHSNLNACEAEQNAYWGCF